MVKTQKLTLGKLRKHLLGLKDNTEVVVFYDGVFDDRPKVYVKNGNLIIDCESRTDLKTIKGE